MKLTEKEFEKQEREKAEKDYRERIKRAGELVGKIEGSSELFQPVKDILRIFKAKSTDTLFQHPNYKKATKEEQSQLCVAWDVYDDRFT